MRCFMKKKVVLLISLLLLMSFAFSSQAATDDIPITLFINNHFIYSDTAPFIEDNTIFVPIKEISEALSIDDLKWNSQDSSILLTEGKRTIQIFMDQKTIYVNDHKYYMDAKPRLVDGRAMVPLDFIAENFNFTFTWDKPTASILVTKNGLAPTTRRTSQDFTYEDILWLARIVHVEALNLSQAGKIAVANVVINRKKSNLFPDTVYEVIFASGQFPPAHKPGFAELVPSSGTWKAVKTAIYGQNNVSTCLYFNNAPFRSKSDDLFQIIEGEYFYH